MPFIFMGWMVLSYVFLVFLLSGLILWLYGIFTPQSQLLGPVLYRVDSEGKKVALTFDDGPHEVFTPKILDTLRAYGARATFFVMGVRARQHPRLLERMVAEGHEIGNHTYSHNYFLSAPIYPSSYYQEEILALDKVIESYQLPYAPWVRFPMGFKNGRMIKAARRMGKRVVAFSFRAYDSLGSEEALVARVLRKTYPGAILILHDGPDKWRNNHYNRTVGALPRILERLKAEGYNLVTLGELDRGSTAGKF